MRCIWTFVVTEKDSQVKTVILKNDTATKATDRPSVALINAAPTGEELNLRIDGKDLISGVNPGEEFVVCSGAMTLTPYNACQQETEPATDQDRRNWVLANKTRQVFAHSMEPMFLKVATATFQRIRDRARAFAQHPFMGQVFAQRAPQRPDLGPNG